MCNEKQDWDIYGDQFEAHEEDWFKTREVNAEVPAKKNVSTKPVCQGCLHPMDCSKCWL
jgi:formylmethanofuran dehydrogenase subunit E